MKTKAKRRLVSKEESTEYLEALGKRVKEIRLALNLTQEDFAGTLGLSNTYLSDIEAGKKNPRMAFFIKLIQNHRVNMNYLFTGSGPIRLNPGHSPDKNPSAIAGIHNTEDMILVMESSTLFRDTIMSYAAQFFMNNELNIKKNIETLMKLKEEQENENHDHQSTKPPWRK